MHQNHQTKAKQAMKKSIQDNNKTIQLQFEWASQNVDKSKSFREAVGGDELGAEGNARLENSRILGKECLPFFIYSLTVYFP